MAVRNTRLPFLPGYGTNTLLGKEKFGLKQWLMTKDNVNMLIDKAVNPNYVPSLYCRKAGPELPTWIIYDKQILRFKAYFQQSLVEWPHQSHVVRKVDILFYLEDGTIKVVEPRTGNSGMMQGVMIARQRICLPFGCDNYYDVIDLNIGREVTFFGKVFKIVDCDNFTRVFLNRLGIHVPDPLPVMDEPTVGAPMKPKYPKHRPFKQFLDFDRQVLRFYGYWDDRDSPFGTLHKLEIHYFLADETMEIKELLSHSSGREGTTMFLKRMRVPRKTPDMVEMTGGPPSLSYGPADFGIGASLDVFGRRVVLTDCDAYTKEYYRVTFGIDTFTPIKAPGEEESSTFPKRVLPPWNGYGSYADSAENCRTVLPKAPHPDFIKFIKKDKQGFDSHCLRFAARLINDRPEDMIRYFVIRYYLSDDTIAISELAARNTGYLGGKFLKRDKVYLPEVEDFFVPVEPPTYQPQDMWVGNEVVINKHQFRLIGADEYAIRYMELHSDEFPKANVRIIMDKIRRVLSSQENLFKDFVAKHMEAVLPNKKDLMTVKYFKQALNEIMGNEMTEHEYITLIRHFFGDPQKDKLPRREMIRSLVFTELTRGLWDDKTRLLEGFRHADEGSTGVLSEHRVQQILRAHRLPINAILMECMLTVLKKDLDCNIYYDDVIDFLDFKTRPVSELTETDYEKVVRHALPLKYMECKIWGELDERIEEGYVNWSAFLCELNLEHLVKEDK